MAKSKQKPPPVKLTWREDALKWLNDNRRELPKGVSRPAAHAVVGMLMQAAQMDGRDVIAAARWLERETGVNHAAAARIVQCLTKAGWLEYVGEGLRGAPIYDLIPASRRITPRSEHESEAERPRGWPTRWRTDSATSWIMS